MNYTVYLNSDNRMAGTDRNNATFLIRWADFIDVSVKKYKVNFWLTTDEGYYMDSIANGFNLARVEVNLFCRSYTFDAGTKGSSNTLGYITRKNSMNSIANATFLSATPFDNFQKVIERPTSDNITVSFFSVYNETPLLDTDASGNVGIDMTKWTMVLNFVPIEN